MALAPTVSLAASGLQDRRLRRGAATTIGASDRTWSGTFDRALFVVFGLIVANDVLVSFAWMTQAFEVSGGTGRASIVLAVAALVGSALAILLGFLRPGLVYGTICAVVGAQLIFAWSTSDPTALPGTWWAWQLTIPLCVLICATLPAARAIPALLLVLIAYSLIRLSEVSGPGYGVVATVSDLSAFGLFAVVVFVTVPAWRQTAAAADIANQARNRSHAMTEAAQAADLQRRAVARILHDEVIHALRAISLPPGAIERTRVRDLAAHACDVLAAGSSLAASGSARPLGPALEQLEIGSTLTVRLQVSGALSLPGPVVDAIAGAVGEALRNVERHSGVNEASVLVRHVPGGVHVTVADTGSGFEEQHITRPLLGYQSSILGRVADVGGNATVSSTPGNGTRVEIQWATSQELSRDASRRLSDIAGTRFRLIAGGVTPLLLFAIAQAGLNYPQLIDPAAALAAVGGIAAITLAALVWARVRPMPGWMSLVLIMSAIAATIAGGWELQPSGHVEVAYFAAGAGGPALALVAFFRPPWESILGALAATAAAGAMVHRMDPDWASMEQALPAVMSNLVGVVAILAIRVTIDRMSRDVLWDEELQRHATSTQAKLSVGRQVMADRLDRVQRWVLPFLRAVAAGRLDPGASAVRQRAAVLEAAVRDDIRLGACLDDRSRALIAQARTAGRQVEINAEPSGATAVPAGVISQLLTAALDDPVEPPDRTVLSISGTPPGGVTASLLVESSTERSALRSVATRIGAIVRSGPTFVLVSVTQPAETSPHLGTTVPVAAPVSSMQ